MGQDRRHLRVFVASPGDVAEERQRARRVLERLNQIHGESLGMHLDPFLWEIGAQPGVGEAQERLNPELDQADLVVVIVKHRLGTPTPRAESGTVEEFERALERHAKSGAPEIFVYHSTEPVPPDLSDEDFEQWARVRAFRKRTKEAVLPFNFRTAEELAELLFGHVFKWVEALMRPAGSAGAKPSPRAALTDWTAYLRLLVERHSRIDMPGLAGTSVRQLALDRVYVRLRVQGPARGGEGEEIGGPGLRERLEQGVEALRSDGPMALVGEPGAGKTTILRYVTLQLARHHLGLESKAREELGFLAGEVPVPVFVEFTALADALRARGWNERKKVSPRTWSELLVEHLGQHKAEMDAGGLERLLEDGRLLLIFDALDEVSGVRTRERLAGAVAELADSIRADGKRPAQVLVTCRTRAWGEGKRFSAFEQARLLDLDDEAIESFLRRWSAAVCNLAPQAPPESDPACAELLAGLRRSILETAGVRRIATNPQMLTMLAVVYHHGKRRLPEQRALLYQRCVEHLLESRADALDDWGGPAAARRHLQALALAMQEARDADGGPRDALDRDAAIELLSARLAPLEGEEPAARRDRAVDLFAALELATGLVVSADRDLRFHHRTFQEYLVATEIAGRTDPGQALEPHAADPAWIEVAALTAGLLAQGGEDRTRDLLRALAGPPDEAIAQRAARAAVLALCLRDLEP